jgi:hypothetical protein
VTGLLLPRSRGIRAREPWGGILERIPYLRDSIGRLVRGDAHRLYETWIAAYGDGGDLSAVKDELATLAEPSLLSARGAANGGARASSCRAADYRTEGVYC